jgi:hypothetical protein
MTEKYGHYVKRIRQTMLLTTSELNGSAHNPSGKGTYIFIRI